jgi:Rieske Fe-S protein
MAKYISHINKKGSVMKDELVKRKRRKFLKYGASILGMTASGNALPLFFSGCESTTLKTTGKTFDFDVSSEPSLATIGGAVKKKLDDNNYGNPVIISRVSSTDFIVLTSVCTFEGCSVNIPANPGDNIICPCCRSEYSPVDGHVIKGPASAALRKFQSSYDPSTKILKITF